MAILKSCLNEDIEIEIKISSRTKYSEGIYNLYNLSFKYPTNSEPEWFRQESYDFTEFEYGSTFVSFFEHIVKNYKQDSFKSFPEEDPVVLAYPFVKFPNLEDKSNKNIISLVFSFSKMEGLDEEYNGPTFIITSTIQDFETFVQTLKTEYKNKEITVGKNLEDLFKE